VRNKDELSYEGGAAKDGRESFVGKGIFSGGGGVLCIGERALMLERL